jgi:uncharacterized membrane protein YkvA (DUF1232 family)
VDETSEGSSDFQGMVDLNDDDLAASMQETADSAGGLQDDRAQRFYDRIRGSIQRYIEKKGKAVEKTGEYLLLVPDVFILLWRLTNDSRISGKDKVLLGSSLAYYLFPFDLLPEGLVGPIGYLDDLVFGVYVLNRMLADTDVAILREHWSGSEDVLLTIRRVLDAADNLVGSNLIERLKKMVK